MPHSSGTKLGPYEFLASVGAGAMGAVCTACDTHVGRTFGTRERV